jgi:hypothetical protein
VFQARRVLSPRQLIRENEAWEIVRNSEVNTTLINGLIKTTQALFSLLEIFHLSKKKKRGWKGAVPSL